MLNLNKKVISNTLIWGLATGALYEAFFRKFDRMVLFWMQDQSFQRLSLFSKHIESLLSSAHWIEFGLLCLIAFYVIGHTSKDPQKHPKLEKFRIKAGFIGFSLITTAILGALLKYGLARYRPEMLLEKQLYGFHFFSMQDQNNSTPSGHSMLATAGFLSLDYLINKRWFTWIAYLAILVVGLSRIILSQHYTSDVFFGVYVGAICVYWVKSVREW
jgi:membrane-associated phospholipid phosphatase